MRTPRGIIILKNNKKLSELVVSNPLCSLWLHLPIVMMVEGPDNV